MTKRKVTTKKPIEEGDSKKQKREEDVSIYKIPVKCNKNYFIYNRQFVKETNVLMNLQNRELHA